MTIECKDLEWDRNGTGAPVADAVLKDAYYKVGQFGLAPYWHAMLIDSQGECVWMQAFDTMEQAQAAANEHNKQQFYKLIEQWRKG